MAITITTQVIMNGKKYVVLKVFITGAADDTGIIYDASSYFDGNTNIRLMKIDYELRGFSAKLTWDGQSNTDLLTLTEDEGTQPGAYLDFHDFGGITNKGVGEKTGDIKITTTNIGAADSGHLVLYIEEYTPLFYFTVPDIGPKLWFDGLDSGSVERNSSNIIENWVDKSGQYQHASQSTASQKPLYTTESTSGLPSLLFNSANSQELIGSFASPFSNESFSVFVVSRGLTNNSGVIIGSSNSFSFNYFEMTYFLTAPFNVPIKLINQPGAGYYENTLMRSYHFY